MDVINFHCCSMNEIFHLLILSKNSSFSSVLFEWFKFIKYYV